MSRLDAFWEDSQLDPPHSQGRQPTQAYAGKRRTVVGADGPREAILPEGSFQNRAHLRTSGLAQPMARQEIPGGGILHGKGVDPHSIPGAEPALEVDAPQVVGLLRLGYPAEGVQYGPTRRRPVEEVTYNEKWGQAWAATV